MAYQALYRRFRPLKFSDVRGQDAIVRTLKNQISTGRVGHAYLFCGTRGTGKTTVAKIFARSVNCANPDEDGSPCGECPSCRAILSGSSINVAEIDAASNNGVDNIREIREEVAYPPTDGKYKVYIIDEAHMLSTGAFNALLKTLEEPPSYVIFILATTESNKIPLTVHSRCQRFDFRRMNIATITGRLAELAAAESIEAKEEALKYIARCANGSMRDAISLLDQCAAFYYAQPLTYEGVLDVLGTVDTSVFDRLFELITRKNVAGTVSLLEEAIMQGRDIDAFVGDFCWYLRNLLLISTEDAGMEEVIDVSREGLERMKREASRVSADELMRYIRVMSELTGQIRFSRQKRILTEIALIKLMRPGMEEDISSLSQRVEELERSLASMAVLSRASLVPENTSDSAGRGGSESVKRAQGAGGAGKENVNKAGKVKMEELPVNVREIVGRWGRILSRVDGACSSALRHARPVTKNGKIILMFDESVHFDFMRSRKNSENLAEAIRQETGMNPELEMDIRQAGREMEPDCMELDSLMNLEGLEVEEI